MRDFEALPFSGAAPSASEWAACASGFSGLNGVQTDYAVAYWAGGSWRIAVPIQAPTDGGVEVFMLTSADGATFNGYRRATWYQVEGEMQTSDHVLWDREYVGEAPQVFVD